MCTPVHNWARKLCNGSVVPQHMVLSSGTNCCSDNTALLAGKEPLLKASVFNHGMTHVKIGCPM